jgi:molecular chaperone HtpG
MKEEKNESEDAKIEEVEEQDHHQHEKKDKKKKKEKVKKHEWELVNKNKPIWMRNPKDVTKEEYATFFNE